MSSGMVLGFGLCFHYHAPQQTSIRLAFHQPAANQVWSDQLGRAGEEGLVKRWEILDDECDNDGPSSTPLTFSQHP